jgi:hypothetical protein
MLRELITLKEEIEDQSGDMLTSEEIAFLESVKGPEDLANYGKLEDLAYDTAIAMGFTDEEAEKLIEGETSVPTIESLKITDEYLKLVKDVNLLNDLIYEAEYQMVEETSSEGFASKETSAKAKELTARLNEARHKLESFKYENQDFVARYKAVKKQEKEARNVEMFERFWNN